MPHSANDAEDSVAAGDEMMMGRWLQVARDMPVMQMTVMKMWSSFLNHVQEACDLWCKEDIEHEATVS